MVVLYLQSALEANVDHSKWTFEVEIGTYVMDDALPYGDGWEVLVLPNVVVLDAGRLASDASPLDLRELSKLTKSEKRQAPTPLANLSGLSDEQKKMIADNPWLSAYVNAGSAPTPTTASRKPAGGPSSSDTVAATSSASSADGAQGVGVAASAEADDDGPLADAAVGGRLEGSRKAWRRALATLKEAFHVLLSGGGWCRRVLGVDYDAFKGLAKGQDVQQWCVAKRLGQTKHFAIQKFGEHEAANLAKAWVHKMHFLFDLVGGDPGKPFTPDGLASYVEDASQQQWLDKVPPAGPVADALHAIRSLP